MPERLRGISAVFKRLMQNRKPMYLGAAMLGVLAFGIPSNALDGLINRSALTVDISELGSGTTDRVVVLAHPVTGNPWAGATHRLCEWDGKAGKVTVGEAWAQSGSNANTCVISGINDLAAGEYVVDAAVFSDGEKSPIGCSSVVLAVDGPSEVTLPVMQPCI